MKKVLSWVLVLALVLGSFSMAFAGDTDNASNMKDAAQIKNVEAVDVMVATGIIGGYPDGNYYPEKTVTRAEMAKMICIALNGGEDVGSYYASSCKFADSKDHWAAGYIAYCANEGIIDGRDADTFDPDATVTGTEAAKMMLVAIGYDSKIEKLTGEQWAANVLKLAKANDLFDGCDNFAAGAPLNRDNAAQIIFNGLQAEMVHYFFDAEITTGDTTVTVNTKVMGTDTALYEDAFDGDLVKAESKADGFGRPAHKWSLEKDEIGTYADEADYTFVVTDDDSLEAALDAYDEDLCDEFYGTSADKTISSAVNNGDEFDTLWLGDVVELFDLDTVTNEKDNYKAVVLTYELGTIEEVDKEVSDKDAKDGVSAYVTIDGVTINDTDLPGYDAKTYVEDAVIAVAWDFASDDDEVLDSYVPEKVTGELTKYYSDSTYIDGTKYNNGTNWSATALTIGNEYDFYFVNDYIYEAVEVTDNNPYSYAIYLGYKVDEGYSDDDDVYSVKLFTAEGKTETYTLNSDAMEEGAIRQPDANDLIAYTVNDDNEIDFIKIATGSAFDKEMKTNGILNGKKVAEDVVAFSYDGEDWSTNDYDDLKAAESVDAATYLMNRDGDEMAAIKLATPLEDTTTDVYGFITDVDRNAKNADKKDIYVVTALIDGKEVTLDTVALNDATIDISDGFLTLYKFTLNEDKEIVALDNASCFAVNDIEDEFGDYDVAFMTNATLDGIKTVFDDEDLLYITEKSGNLLDVGTYVEDVHNKDFQSVDGAVFYQVKLDGQTPVVEVAALRDVKKGYLAGLFQTDEDAAAWNIVVFVNPADFE